MADYYYEVSPLAVEDYGHKYHVALNCTGDAMMAAGFLLTAQSDRIWREDGNDVKFIKHRWNVLGTSVDLKEFMWIKLQAQEIKGA